MQFDLDRINHYDIFVGGRRITNIIGAEFRVYTYNSSVYLRFLCIEKGQVNLEEHTIDRYTFKPKW